MEAGNKVNKEVVKPDWQLRLSWAGTRCPWLHRPIKWCHRRKMAALVSWIDLICFLYFGPNKPTSSLGPSNLSGLSGRSCVSLLLTLVRSSDRTSPGWAVFGVWPRLAELRREALVPPAGAGAAGLVPLQPCSSAGRRRLQLSAPPRWLWLEPGEAS